jgi:hypothetical protein
LRPARARQGRLEERLYAVPIFRMDDPERVVGHGKTLIDRVPRHALDPGVDPPDAPVRQEPALPVVSVVGDDLEQIVTHAEAPFGPLEQVSPIWAPHSSLCAIASAGHSPHRRGVTNLGLRRCRASPGSVFFRPIVRRLKENR